jgi:hypothetical protein
VPGDAAEPLPLVIAPRAAWLEFCRLTNSGVARRAAINELARSSGKSSREIYSLIERGKQAASNAEAEAEAEQTAQNGPAGDAPTPSPEKQTRRTPITD